MTTVAIREKLMNYLATADSAQVKNFYLLVEDEISKNQKFELTEDHLEILDKEKVLHANGKSKSYDWPTTKEIIRRKRAL